MKNINFFISILVLGTFFSCLNFEPSFEQQYVNYQMDNVKEIIVTDKKTGDKQKIADRAELNKLSQFLNDSTNYFSGDRINFDGAKSTHRLDFVRELDTLTLSLYPTSEPENIEVAYFDPEELKIKDSYKEYKRFLIHRDILNFIPSSSD